MSPFDWFDLVLFSLPGFVALEFFCGVFFSRFRPKVIERHTPRAMQLCRQSFDVITIPYSLTSQANSLAFPSHSCGTSFIVVVVVVVVVATGRSALAIAIV